MERFKIRIGSELDVGFFGPGKIRNVCVCTVLLERKE